MGQMHTLWGWCAWVTSCSFCSLIASEVVEAEVAHRKACLILMYTAKYFYCTITLSYTFWKSMGQIITLWGCCAWATSCSFCSIIATEAVEARVPRRKICLILMPNTTPTVLSPCLIIFWKSMGQIHTLLGCAWATSCTAACSLRRSLRPELHAESSA